MSAVAPKSGISDRESQLPELKGQGLLGPMNARDRGAAGAGGLQKPGRQAPILAYIPRWGIQTLTFHDHEEIYAL